MTGRGDFSADLEPHEYTPGMPDGVRCACGKSRSAPIHDAGTLERAADLLSSGHPSRGDRTVARRAQRAAIVLREMAQRLREYAK